MSNNPDEIRRDIEHTRGRLSDDVNTLTENGPAVERGTAAGKVVDAASGTRRRSWALRTTSRAAAAVRSRAWPTLPEP